VNRVYIRHIGLAVVVGALLAPAWVPGLQTTVSEPLSFATGMIVAVAGLVVWGTLENRRQEK
jgi:hypothetical protein